MTALARPVAIETPKPHELITPFDTLDTDNLQLSGNDPVSVHVRISNSTPQFSSDGTTWHDGISWTSGTDDSAYALIITYKLAASVDELGPSTTTPTLWFSPVLTDENKNRTQIGYLPPVTQATTFSINVSNATGPRDPQIVVTPA